jgi:two-component system sensor histidine kinase ResE
LEGKVSNQSPAQTSFTADPPSGPSAPSVEEQLKAEVYQRTLLLASAAHELKTPLAVIAGYADFLLGDNAGPLNQQQKDVLTEMQRSTLRLQRLIEGFLKISTLQSGKVEIKKEPRDINQCIAEVIAQWRVPYAARGTTVEFLPDETLEPIWVDNLKLQNILSNLLDNALKFSPPFGRVAVSVKADRWDRRASRSEKTIHLERRNPAAVECNNCVRIDVTDNGAGIPAEYHREIFEEFRQIDPAGRTAGIGLGLAIAGKLVEAHGGKIEVNSIVGQGSTFSVLLPR